MPKTGKTRSYIWLALKSVIAGSVVVSRTFAAPVPAAPDHVGLVDDWRSVGQQMGNNPNGLPGLDQSIIDMISASDLNADLADVVFASYEMVEQSQIGALDAHWAAYLTDNGNAALVAEFLNLRTTLHQNMTSQNDADAILWLAGNHNNDGCDGGKCDNGWGNDDDCAPGNSAENNNGENHGGDPFDGTEDGSSNSSDNGKNGRN